MNTPVPDWLALRAELLTAVTDTARRAGDVRLSTSADGYVFRSVGPVACSGTVGRLSSMSRMALTRKNRFAHESSTWHGPMGGMAIDGLRLCYIRKAGA